MEDEVESLWLEDEDEEWGMGIGSRGGEWGNGECRMVGYVLPEVPLSSEAVRVGGYHLHKIEGAPKLH